MKKSVRSTLVKSAALLAVLVAIAAIYFIRISNLPAKSVKSGGTTVLPELKPNDMVFLSIRQTSVSNRGRIVLEKDKDAWKIVSPVKDDADPESVSLVLNGLTGLKSDRIFTNADPEDYGFTDAALTIGVSNYDGTSYSLTVGAISSDGRYEYVMRGNNSNLVFLVPVNQFSNILKAPDDLRTREIFNIALNDLSGVEWATPDGEFRFRFSGQDNGDIFLISPKKEKTDASLVRSKLIGLYSLSVSGFVDRQADTRTLSEFGLGKPSYSFRLESRDGRVNSLLVGKADKSGSLYVFIPQKNILALIGGDDLTNILNMRLDDVLPGKGRR